MRTILLLLAAVTVFACDDRAAMQPAADSEMLSEYSPVETAAQSDGEGAVKDAEIGPGQPSLEQIQADIGIPVLSKPWTGDLDGMIERRLVRVLTVYGQGKYYIEKGREKGMTYELFKMLENDLNEQLGRKHVRVHVVFIPVARDELISGLRSGRGDIAAAGLTMTPEREALVDFSEPLTRELSEVLVTGPTASAVAALEDLAGRKIYVRASSSYRSSLDDLNRKFREEGREELKVIDVSEYLEDEDILELVNSGAIDWTVVDDYKAEIWAGVFENLTVRNDIVFRTGGRLGHAVRKNSPQLLEVLNEFARTHRQGTLMGNILIKRYVDDFDWSRNALSEEDFRRFRETVDVFEKYGDQYGFDYLIVTAQGYQESQLKQSARSSAGAIGIMQLLPSTAADPNVGIPDISEADANIHAGVRYMNFIRDRYFNDAGMDDLNKTLFALAAYNAGPARVARLRKTAEQQGYDPNVWFDNVEMIAAREIGLETVQYVANIIKYYVTYRLSLIRNLQRAEEKNKAAQIQ